MSDKKLLFELHGFEVREDSIYLVTDKIDYSAPTGFVEAGTSKLPSDGVGNSFHCPYIRLSKSEGQWDSGLYELSPCYKGMSREAVKVLVKSLNKNVVEPYRRAIGKEDALDQHNDKFFDNTSWTVAEGDVYKTDNPVDVVSLYFALLKRELTPKKLAGDSTFGSSSYFIIDINEKRKKRDEDASNMFEAVGTFEALYKTDKDSLDVILYYIGRNMAEETNQDAYRGMFKAYLENAPSNIKMFNKLVEDLDTDIGRAKLNIYRALKSRDIRNPKVHKTVNGALFYEDVEIGIDFKSAAERIAKDPSMADIKREILLGSDDEEYDGED